jgi:hypothetical protein
MLLQNRQTDPGNVRIAHRYMTRKLERGHAVSFLGIHQSDLLCRATPNFLCQLIQGDGYLPSLSLILSYLNAKVRGFANITGKRAGHRSSFLLAIIRQCWFLCSFLQQMHFRPWFLKLYHSTMSVLLLVFTREVYKAHLNPSIFRAIILLYWFMCSYYNILQSFENILHILPWLLLLFLDDTQLIRLLIRQSW